jgi:4-diphosphocytidyl-2-C-methyl-D-erythritol kinase
LQAIAKLELTARAHAKINLHLEILNRREDGYHNIFSLMALTGLFDLLKLTGLSAGDSRQETIVKLSDAGGIYSGLMESIPHEDNLIVRAVKSYFNRIRKSGRVSVSVEKNIPSGAGLGGGSSDAAAVLKLLNSHFTALDEAELMELGASLGSDIPFCITGGIAICTGRGDIVEPVKGAIGGSVLIVNDGTKINTASAYRDLGRGSIPHHSSERIDDVRRHITIGLESGGIESIKDVLKNDFEAVIFRNHPGLKLIKEEMLDSGADFAIMTGSGSSITGIFRSDGTAREAEKKLRARAEYTAITEVLKYMNGAS